MAVSLLTRPCRMFNGYVTAKYKSLHYQVNVDVLTDFLEIFLKDTRYIYFMLYSDDVYTEFRMWHINKAFIFIWWWLPTVLIWSLVTAYNFSHRIDHLSFGEGIPGIISPLDGTEKVSADCMSVLSYMNQFLSYSFFIDRHCVVFFVQHLKLLL